MQFNATELKLTGKKPLTKNVTPDAQSVQFDIDLPAGPVDIEAWFTLSDGNRLGAYFVYVEEL